MDSSSNVGVEAAPAGRAVSCTHEKVEETARHRRQHRLGPHRRGSLELRRYGCQQGRDRETALVSHRTLDSHAQNATQDPESAWPGTQDTPYQKAGDRAASGYWRCEAAVRQCNEKGAWVRRGRREDLRKGGLKRHKNELRVWGRKHLKCSIGLFRNTTYTTHRRLVN